MKLLERFDLIDRVGRELQARMTYSDIDAYLSACGVDTSKSTSDVNSKWVYVKDSLADEDGQKIIEIADEVELEHGYVTRKDLSVDDSRFWMPGYFRLFISHLSVDKKKASQLQQALKRFGISGFVAHEDIEPTKEWLKPGL